MEREEGLEMCIQLYSDITEQARHSMPPLQVSIAHYHSMVQALMA